MDRFSLQPAGGTQGIFSNASGHEGLPRLERRHAPQRDHHDDLLAPGQRRRAGDRRLQGHHRCTRVRTATPTSSALKAAVGERTAGMLHHQPGGHRDLQPADRGIRRASCTMRAGSASTTRRTRTASSGSRGRATPASTCATSTCTRRSGVPHGCMGGAVGAEGVTDALAPFLPTPAVEFDGSRYSIRMSGPSSVGTLRAWLGNVHSLVKSYSWITTMGSDGLCATAEAAVLNNNYLIKQILAIKGASVSSATPTRPPARPGAIQLGAADGRHGHHHDAGPRSGYRLRRPELLHQPSPVADPGAVQPRAGRGYFDRGSRRVRGVLARISHEAYTDPDIVRTAPHRSTSAPVIPASYDEPYMTWQAYERRRPAADPAG